MRPLLLTTTLLALYPGLAVAAEQCAVTPSSIIPYTTKNATSVPLDPRIAIPTPMQVSGPSVPLAPVVQASVRTPAAAPVLPPSQADASARPDALELVDLKSIPGLAHFSHAGAKLSDLGETHGLRTVFASNSGQFMVFEVTPDGQATVAGLVTDLSLARLQALAGSDLTALTPAHGLKGYFLRNGSKYQVFYETPDGAGIIPGIMWDAAGKDLTHDQVAGIPGAIPTVTIGQMPPASASQTASAASSSSSASLLEVAEKTAYGTIGRAGAPQLWMFVDPQCSFSIRAMQQLQPYVAGGRLQLHIIPLTILDHEDDGLSTRNALRLISTPGDQMVQAWETGNIPADGSAPEAGAKLQENMAAANTIQVRGTPTFLWRRPDGSLGRLDGVPGNVDAMLTTVGL